MKLNVLRANKPVSNIDLMEQIKGSESSEINFYLGRSESCHVQLDDKMISREHALISYNAGSWSIKSLSDYAPIYLNGEPCTEAPLNNGDILGVAPFTVNVFLVDGVVEKPVAVESSNEEAEVEGTETITHQQEMDEEETADNDGEDEFAEDSQLIATSILENRDEDELNEDDSDDENEYDAFESQEFRVGEMDNSDEEFDSSEDDTEDAFDTGGDDFEDSSDNDFAMEESDGNESTQVLQSFASFHLELFGEDVPYDQYRLDEPETFIGSDSEKCQIVLSGEDVADVHLVIKKTHINCMIEDLGSEFGTMLNGKRIKKEELSNNDEFIVGDVTFTVKVKSDFMEDEEDRLMPVEENQMIEVEEVVDDLENFSDEYGEIQEVPDGNVSLFSKEALQDPEKRKKLLIYAVVLLGLWVMLDDGGETKKKPKKKAAAKNSRLLEQKDNQVINKETNRPLTEEEIEFVDSTYLVAKELYDVGKYKEAIFEFEKILTLTTGYKQTQQMYDLAKQGLKALEDAERRRQSEIERKLNQKKVLEILEKARAAVKERNVTLAEALFSQVIELDPENFEVSQLRLELDAWKREQERIALEKAQAEAERNRMLEALKPGEKAFNLKNWHNAIVQLETFLELKDTDEDLVKKASDMLNKSKNELDSIVSPLVGKARSLSEGNDLKGAYETYKEILGFDPYNEEALNEMDAIKESLRIRSRKIYREALVAESLSLFDQAKQKFKEVQQVAPTDSEYYTKATDKLKQYIE